MWRGVDLLRVFVCHLPAAILCREGDVSDRVRARCCRSWKKEAEIPATSRNRVGRDPAATTATKLWIMDGARHASRESRSWTLRAPHVLCKGIGVSGDRGVRLRWTRLSCPGPVRAAGCRHHRSDVRNRRRKRPAPRGRTACPCSGIARPWLR